MDARAFGDFLVEKLGDALKTVEHNLLNGAYEKIDQTLRASGTRDILKELTTKMDTLLTDFHKSRDGSE